MKIDPDAPAMPFSVDVPEIHHLEGGHTTPAYTHMNPGLTIRAHLAAMAMQGMMSNQIIIQAMAHAGMSDAESNASIAKRAVAIADAVVSELNK